jgi:60 kDa SS-A/Ro ribonucleoprotein
MEIATRNVPKIEGKVYVFPDVSGSMHSPVTGHRDGATSQVRCIDVAALVAATVLRQNPQAEVIPFSDHVVQADLNARDSGDDQRRKAGQLALRRNELQRAADSVEPAQSQRRLDRLRFR